MVLHGALSPLLLTVVILCIRYTHLPTFTLTVFTKLLNGNTTGLVCVQIVLI